MDLTVRAARADDEVGVTEVDRLATAALRRIYRPTEAARARRAVIASHTQRIVALVGKQVVGVVDYYAAADRLSFLGLGVHPEFLRCGIATALVQEVERIAAATRYASIVLHTVKETGNVRIFERMGYRVESEALTDLFEGIDGRQVSEVVMSKRVG